jgi:hypothetical protein
VRMPEDDETRVVRGRIRSNTGGHRGSWLRMAEPDDDSADVEGSTVLARSRGAPGQDAAARAAMLAQSLAAEQVTSAIGELARQVTGGLSEGLRMKAALELIRIASTPPELAAGSGEDGPASGPRQPQVIIMDMAEAARMARKANTDDE